MLPPMVSLYNRGLKTVKSYIILQDTASLFWVVLFFVFLIKLTLFKLEPQ